MNYYTQDRSARDMVELPNRRRDTADFELVEHTTLQQRRAFWSEFVIAGGNPPASFEET
jgi:hypothetical protein